jgi:heme-degrading monooxygenase HmoA
MDQNTSHEGSHEGHGIHLPDPSAWPLIVGFAALFLGLTLIWWSRDRENDAAGPFVGAAAVFTLASAAGWAYEDGRMRKKAEEGELTSRRDARYTQVITFAVAEEAAANARTEDGVIHALESASSPLRDFAGFQDLRITASPTGTGPLQVLAETTWSSREGLATYEESRQTLTAGGWMTWARIGRSR